VLKPKRRFQIGTEGGSLAANGERVAVKEGDKAGSADIAHVTSNASLTSAAIDAAKGGLGECSGMVVRVGSFVFGNAAAEEHAALRTRLGAKGALSNV
jgi:hypothetical protein